MGNLRFGQNSLFGQPYNSNRNAIPTLNEFRLGYNRTCLAMNETSLRLIVVESVFPGNSFEEKQNLSNYFT